MKWPPLRTRLVDYFSSMVHGWSITKLDLLFENPSLLVLYQKCQKKWYDIRTSQKITHPIIIPNQACLIVEFFAFRSALVSWITVINVYRGTLNFYGRKNVVQKFMLPAWPTPFENTISIH